ncbi:MAG TPA: MFS transporter [Gemmatimonadaceae bacterium]|nr:MFS transporter [Gemmatimonadaceae bacterium]
METAADIRAPRDPGIKARLLDRLGLHRPELRAWAMYDWAASAVQTTIMVAVFPIYFIRVAGAGVAPEVANQHLATANAISVAIVALLSPVLGAIADYSGRKKQLLAVFLVIGVISTAGMFFIGSGDLRLAESLYVLSMSAVAGTYVFYESLLPHIASESEMDRVSTAGYAIGYTGGGVLLALNLAWIQKPAWFGLPSGDGLTPDQASLPARLAFLSVAVWWLLFSIPLFRGVSEPPRLLEPDEVPRGSVVRHAFVRLGETFHELRGYRHAFLMLIAFLFYNDGISTIQKMAAAYATELNIPQDAVITAILIVQFLGIPFSFLFGMVAGRIGAKRAVFVGLLVYTGISILGYHMSTATHFYVLAALVGMVQGGTQALSRSLFANMIPRHKSGEFFGFFSVFNKFAGIFGPLLFASVIGTTGSSRQAILSVIAFFALGGFLLAFVNVRVGEAAAREAEQRVITAK